jgi:hypothetical protein
MKRRRFLKHVGVASLAAPVFTAFQVRAVTPTGATARTFLSRLQPAVAGGGFEMTDYWVWCGAPIRGEDGRYHLFASRVPKEVPFHPHSLFCSEIVRAESEKPVGPYRFAEVALPPRGGDFFDARSTHNPHIRKVGDTFLLLYMGTNYDGPTPSREHPEVWRSPRYRATLAYRRTVRWSDGRTTQQGFLERPQLLIENSIPTHLFCATAEGPGDDLKDATRTRNIVFPLGR